MKYILLLLALIYIWYAAIAESKILVLVSNTLHHCNAHVFIGTSIVAICKSRVIVSDNYKMQYLGE